MTNSKTTESTRILLSEIIDYAGLFPPSELSMPEAVINFATYKNSNYKWMLGRFVVPFKRLDEFTESAKEFFSRTGEIWKLSVLAGEDVYETVRRVKEFNAEHSANAVCDALEIKVADAPEIEDHAAHIPENLKAYFELPLNETLGETVTALALTKHRAKIRTGGVTAEAFPSVQEITRFIRTCMAANVPFKCTAGLHHPVRCVKPLTYQANAPKGMMNGFLNVFLAAAFVMQGFKAKVIHELLEDEWAESFLFDETGVLWRQEYFVSNSHLRILRERGAISFGSCSFEEPIADLQELGLL